MNPMMPLEFELKSDIFKSYADASDTPISTRYVFIDNFAIFFHALNLSLSTDPSFCSQAEKNDQCKGKGFHILSQHDCSLPAVAIRILQQMAYDAMDQVILIRYNSYFRGFGIGVSIENPEGVSARHHSIPTCSASCCCLATNLRNDILNKAKNCSKPFTIDNDCDPNIKSFILFSHPHLFFESFSSFKFLTKDTLSQPCTSLSYTAMELLSELPRYTDTNICNISTAIDWMNQACVIANNSKTDIMTHISSLWALSMAQMFWIQDYLLGLQTINKLESHALAYLDSPSVLFYDSVFLLFRP